MKKHIIIPAYYICCSILIEITTFLLLGLGFLPKYFMFDLSVILFLAGLVLLCRNTLAQTIVASILIVFQLALCYVNYTLLIQFGDVLSVEMLMLISAARNAMNNDFINIWIMLGIIALMVFMVVGLVLLHLKIRKMPSSRSRRMAGILVAVVLFSQLGSVAIYNAQREYIYAMSEIGAEDYIESDTFLLDSTLLKRRAIQSLGTFGFYVNDIGLSWFNDTRYEKNLNTMALEYLRQGHPARQSVANDQHNKNAIVIMVESFDLFAVSNELTPNVWKLINPVNSAGSDMTYNPADPDSLKTWDDVVNCNSNAVLTYFSKNKTNISEDVSLMGSYPIMTNLQTVAGAKYDKSKNAFDFGLPKILSNEGYITTYLHSYRGTFYERKYVIDNIGFQNQYFNDEVYDKDNLKFGDWRREEEFVINNIDHIIPSTTEKFFTFYTTVGMHGDYENDKNNLAQQTYQDDAVNSKHYAYYIDKTSKGEDEGLGTEMYNYFKNYLASVIDFDRAVGQIIDKLEAEGIYDDTAIYIFGDHNAYYHNLTYAFKDVVINDYGNYYVNNIPMIIKSTASENVTLSGIKSMVSTNDVLPTVMDILGVKINNNNLYLGESIFNLCGEEFKERVNFSYTGGVASTNFYTLDLKRFDLQPGGDESYKSEFKNLAKDMLKKIFLLNALYKNALYSQI